jgi:hypothetical protein
MEMAEERREEKTAAPEQGPDLGALLGGLLGGAGASGGLGDGLNAVLRDPEAMAKLPAMIEMLRPMMSGGGGAPSEAGEGGESAPVSLSPRVDAPPRKEAPPPKAGEKRGGCHERRIALLCALRPYLNPRRQEAIDYILRMDRMGKLFRQG